MKQRPHKTGEEFQENRMRGVVLMAAFLLAMLVAGIILIARGLT
ncbi:MAG: hypothetical protein Q7S40_25275 [Opitutaceae bacterium]|nr:hypothetical protein [Opitutaceae bacterium]